uniref:C2H2-type domain-containing protein n=1 Tax=Plectus sambesii TaxID=2011161 RepID=A0A914WIR3_9BILA
MTLLCSSSWNEGPVVTLGGYRQRAASLDSVVTAMKLERNSLLRQLLTAAPANLSMAKQPRPARIEAARLDAAVLACRPCTTVLTQVTPKKSPRRLSRDSFVPLKSKSQRREDFHDTTPPLEQLELEDKAAVCAKKRRSLGPTVALLTDASPPLLSRGDSINSNTSTNSLNSANSSSNDRKSPSTDSGFESSSPASPESTLGDTQSAVPPLFVSGKPSELPKASPQARSQCQWQWCSLSFENDTLLFDHVIESHIRPLKPSEPAHNTRRRRSNSDIGLLQCRWGQCSMKLERGEVDKRYAWLEDHFTTRHPGRALPYPCLIAGCQQRFSFKRALADHLRSGHEKLRAAAKRDNSDSSAACDDSQKRLKRRSEHLPSLYAITVDPKMDFLDAGTGDVLAARLLAMETARRRRLTPAVANDEARGAARRKMRRVTVHEVLGTSKKRAVAAATAYSNATPLVDRCRTRPVLCALFARIGASKVAVLH